MNRNNAPPASPCIGVCRMHAGRCIGCQRTAAEIAEHGRKVLAWQRAQMQSAPTPSKESKTNTTHEP